MIGCNMTVLPSPLYRQSEVLTAVEMPIYRIPRIQKIEWRNSYVFLARSRRGENQSGLSMLSYPLKSWIFSDNMNKHLNESKSVQLF
jgi:hypothetical protein